MNDGSVEVRACPLCSGTDGRPLFDVSYARIWEALRTEWGVELNGSIRRRHEAAEVTRLIRCSTCGLAYFRPAVAGDAEFYRALGGSMQTYAPDRWEFALVRARLRGVDALLDLGCADGRFLMGAAALVRRAVGVDHNADAIARLRDAGIDAHVSDFWTFAEGREASFDVVCAFQLLEHLSDVSRLVEPAMRVLRPGGRLYVSVPNAARLGARQIEALDCPPHHLSRWEPRLLTILAARSGLELTGLVTEPPDLSQVRLEYRNLVGRSSVRFAGDAVTRIAGRAFAKAIVGPRRHAVSAASQRYQRRGWFGHSILAEFRLP
jgi:SAM-dependent methyltransferase